MQAAAPAVPRRAVIGAGLVALAIGLAAWAGLSGAALAPASTDYQFSRGTQLATGEEARMKADIARAAADDRCICGSSAIAGPRATQPPTCACPKIAPKPPAASRWRPVCRPAGSTGSAGRRRRSAPRGDDMGDRAYQSGLARVTLIWRLQP